MKTIGYVCGYFHIQMTVMEYIDFQFLKLIPEHRRVRCWIFCLLVGRNNSPKTFLVFW